MTGADCQPEVLASILGNRPLEVPTDHVYRPRITWMQGTEARHITDDSLLTPEGMQEAIRNVATTLDEGVALMVKHAATGDVVLIPAQLITEVRYQRVQVATVHRPETTEPTGQRECCAPPSGVCTCAEDVPPKAAIAHHPYGVCEIPHVTADDEDACETQRVALAEQEARHPGLSRLLNALVTQLPPDDPDRCAQTLAAMDAARPDGVPTYAERKCPCWPGQCTCTEAIAVQGIPYVKGPLHAPHVIDPEQ